MDKPWISFFWDSHDKIVAGRGQEHHNDVLKRVWPGLQKDAEKKGIEPSELVAKKGWTAGAYIQRPRKSVIIHPPEGKHFSDQNMRDMAFDAAVFFKIPTSEWGRVQIVQGSLGAEWGIDRVVGTLTEARVESIVEALLQEDSVSYALAGSQPTVNQFWDLINTSSRFAPLRRYIDKKRSMRGRSDNEVSFFFPKGMKDDIKKDLAYMHSIAKGMGVKVKSAGFLMRGPDPRTSTGRKALRMGEADSPSQEKFERTLKPGMRVEARWTTSGSSYRAPVIIYKVGRSTVSGKLLKAVPYDRDDGEYPKGYVVRALPLLSGGAFRRFSKQNGVFPL